MFFMFFYENKLLQIANLAKVNYVGHIHHISLFPNFFSIVSVFQIPLASAPETEFFCEGFLAHNIVLVFQIP